MRTFKAELLCLSEFYYYIKRHRRYFTIFLFLYVFSPFYWKKLKLFRLGFCFLQYIDDVLDGDRVHLQPEQLSDQVIWEITNGSFSETRHGILAESLFTNAGKYGVDVTSLKQEILILIRVMQIDYERRCYHTISPAADLQQQFRGTFSGSINVAMLIWQADIRAMDVPHLIDCFAWCSCIRDLEEDCKKGLINIPKEVTGELNGDLFDFKLFMQTESYKKWIQHEFAHAKSDLNATQDELLALKRQKGYALLIIFYSSMEKFHHKFKVSNPELFS